MDFQINKLPVVIIASPRTGSSALVYHISNTYNLSRITEPYMITSDFLKLSKESQYWNLYHRKKLSTHLKNANDKFVVKLMLNEITIFSPYESILQKDCFKIKLTRSSIIEQIASAYIADMIKKNHSYDNETFDDFIVKIDTLKLINTIEAITNTNFIINNLNLEYDLDLRYEDLGLIENTMDSEGKSLVVNKKPNNYDEILSTIKKLISTFKYQ